MPRDVVIVPCNERPEYTRLCLEYLSKARGVQDKNVWLSQDNHCDPMHAEQLMEMFPVADFGYKTFPFFQHHIMASHQSYGNSANLITSLTRAYNEEGERIFLVEDDIMVSPDFFEWHERMLSEVHPFVSCASALNKSAHFQINGPDRMDEWINDPAAYKQVIGPYSSHAVAFQRFAVGDLLKYINKRAPAWMPGFEQDLMTQAYLKASGNRSVWPYVPRAYNIGMRSYHINTAMPIFGTLEQKVAALRTIIKDPAKLREMSCNNQAITAVPEFGGGW